jgi:RecB family endonuclease NucS
MIENGLRILEKEKRIGDGYADLFGIDAEGKPVIIEIKRVSATRDAVLQLYNYVLEYYKQTGIKPRGILVAPTITSSAVESARKLSLEWKEINLQKLWKLKKERESRSRGTILDYFRK